MVHIKKHTTLNVLLLLLASLVHKVTSATYFVIPDDYSSHLTDANTFTLQHYLNNTSKYFVFHNHFHFMQGQHYINRDLIIKDIDNFTITGPKIGQCNIICTSPASIVVVNVNKIEIQNINLISCINNHKKYFSALTSYFNKWYTSDSIPFSKVTDYFTSLLLYKSSSVIIYDMNINATVNINFTAILAVNLKDKSKMFNVKVQVNTFNCILFINHSLEICGLKVVVHQYDKNMMCNNGSLTIEHFLYNNENSCENYSFCAIVTLFLENKKHDIANRFDLEILNSVFHNLKNSSILCSCGETKEIHETVKIKRVVKIKNSTFSENIGNLQLNMFNIALICLASLCSDLRLKMMNQMYRYAIEFSECTFTRNANMKALISVTPPATRTTVGNIIMFNCTFTENKNMTFIKVKQEFQTVFYKIIKILLCGVNVSSNQHCCGDNLILITNVRLEIANSFFNRNNYYENIFNLESSELFIKPKYSEICNNYARHIIKASFIFMNHLVTINISHNVVYKVIEQVSTFERYAICPLIQQYLQEIIKRVSILMKLTVHCYCQTIWK